MGIGYAFQKHEVEIFTDSIAGLTARDVQTVIPNERNFP